VARRKKYDHCRECAHFLEALYAGRINNEPVYRCEEIIDWLVTTEQPRSNFDDWTVHRLTFACPRFVRAGTPPQNPQ